MTQTAFLYTISKNFFMRKTSIEQIATTVQSAGAVAGIFGIVVLVFAYCIEETTRAGYCIGVMLSGMGTLMAVFGTIMKSAQQFDEE